MNEARIETAARSIARYKAALKWLEEYGVKIEARGDSAKVRVDLHFAGSCPGSKEAAEVIEAYARLSLPEIIKQAIQSCHNTITLETDAIRAEVQP